MRPAGRRRYLVDRISAVFVIALKFLWKLRVIALLVFRRFVFALMLVFRLIVIVHGTCRRLGDRKVGGYGNRQLGSAGIRLYSGSGFHDLIVPDVEAEAGFAGYANAVPLSVRCRTDVGSSGYPQ
jgi:hypothetical protein